MFARGRKRRRGKSMMKDLKNRKIIPTQNGKVIHMKKESRYYTKKK